MKQPDTSMRRPGGWHTEKLSGVASRNPAKQRGPILIDEEVFRCEDQVGKCGEPHAIDALDLDHTFQDAAGRADDHAVGRVIGRQAGRVSGAPCRLAPGKQRKYFLAGHD
jgi:hypothetical protein